MDYFGLEEVPNMQEDLENFLPELMKISGFKHPIRD